MVLLNNFVFNKEWAIIYSSRDIQIRNFLLYEIKILVFFEHLAVRLQTLNGVYGSLIDYFCHYEGQIPQKLEASV